MFNKHAFLLPVKRLLLTRNTKVRSAIILKQQRDSSKYKQLRDALEHNTDRKKAKVRQFMVVTV